MNNGNGSDEKEQNLSWKQNLVLYLHDLVIYVSVILLIFLLLFRVIVVDGDSMYSTLWDGDYLLLESRMFCGEPEPGDIVVISKASFDNGSPIVKRVIATEGQTVDIDFESGTVYVDGEALSEAYIHNETTNEEGTEFPLTVADSIDAFAAGVGFAAVNVNIVPAVSLIGVITCVLSAAGVKVGALFGSKYRAPAERAGGVVLVLMGLKTLLSGLGIL